MEGDGKNYCGRISGLASQQDGTQFEDALRRLHAVEKKLTDQVQEDIHQLKSSWVQLRVDRVTHNTLKLWQVRDQLKLSKVLYVEEEQILEEFNKVKKDLITASMDDEYFEATKNTCVFLGGKLTEVRNRQLICYSTSMDLETSINKDIVTLRFEDKDFSELDIERVRATTPCRQMSPTPLERHRSKSREPSPFLLPPMRLGSLGNLTPSQGGGSDPHAYFSRPGSSLSLYGGRGGDKDSGLDAFRAALEAKQACDDSPPKERKAPKLSKSQSGNIVLRSATGLVVSKGDTTDNMLLHGQPGMFINDRPASAMSDMSINVGGVEGGGVSPRPGSRMEFLGDDVSGKVDPFVSGTDFQYQGEEEDEELNLEQDRKRKEEEEEEIRKRAEEQANAIRLEAKKMFEEKEKIRIAEEAAKKKADEEAKREKLRLEKEEEMRLREERRKADEQKIKDMEEKRRLDREKKAEEEIRKKEEEKQKRLEAKQEKMKKAEEAKLKKEMEERKKEEEKQKRLEEKKTKMELAKKKKKIEAEKREEEERKSWEEKWRIEAEKKKTEEDNVNEEELSVQAEEIANQICHEDKATLETDKDMGQVKEKEVEETYMRTTVDMGEKDKTKENNLNEEQMSIQAKEEKNQMCNEDKQTLETDKDKGQVEETEVEYSVEKKEQDQMIPNVELEENRNKQGELKTEENIGVEVQKISGETIIVKEIDKEECQAEIILEKKDKLLDETEIRKEFPNMKEKESQREILETKEGDNLEQQVDIKENTFISENVQLEKTEIEVNKENESANKNKLEKVDQMIADLEPVLIEELTRAEDKEKITEISQLLSEHKSLNEDVVELERELQYESINQSSGERVSEKAANQSEQSTTKSNKKSFQTPTSSFEIPDLEDKNIAPKGSIDASNDADDEEDVSVEKPKTKSRSVSRGRGEAKREETSGDEKEDSAPHVRSKSRSASKGKTKGTEDEREKTAEERPRTKSTNKAESKLETQVKEKESRRKTKAAEDQSVNNLESRPRSKSRSKNGKSNIDSKVADSKLREEDTTKKVKTAEKDSGKNDEELPRPKSRTKEDSKHVTKETAKSKLDSKMKEEDPAKKTKAAEKDSEKKLEEPPRPKSRTKSDSKNVTKETGTKVIEQESKMDELDKIADSKEAAPLPCVEKSQSTEVVEVKYIREGSGDEAVETEEISKIDKPPRKKSSKPETDNEALQKRKEVGEINTFVPDVIKEPESKMGPKPRSRNAYDAEIVEETSEKLSVPEVKVKSRSSSKTRTETAKAELEATGGTGSKGNSRQTSRTGSPVGILKGGKRSRDASRDRGGGATSQVVVTVEGQPDDGGAGTVESVEILSGKPLTRKGSLKKSDSFSRKGGLVDKRKISFDDDVDIEKFEKVDEPIAAAKEIFAAIADTSLESGLAVLKMQKSRSTSRERPGSRGSGSGFPQQEPRELSEAGGDFEDEDELMIILNTDTMVGEEEPELGSLKSRSQSKERAGSRSSQGSLKQGTKMSRSGSGVPELEVVEQDMSTIKDVMVGLKMLDSEMEREEEEGQQSRPLSTTGRQSSTGYSHLDEFERKLAEMENELDTEEATVVAVEEKQEEEGPLLRRGDNTWDLSPQLDRDVTAPTQNFQEVAADFKETFLMAVPPPEELYARVGPKTTRAQEGLLIEQGEVDHSWAQDQVEEDVGSEYVYDEVTGEVRRSKKVSFAESEERYEIERQAKGLSGTLGKFFSLATSSLVGKEKKVELEEETVKQAEEPPEVTTPLVQADEATSPKAFLAAMTGGLLSNRSPDPVRKEGSSLFGSLLRKGKKGSRPGSRQSSGDRSRQSSQDRQRSNQSSQDRQERHQDRQEDLGSETEEGRASSRTGSVENDGALSDAGSENSLVLRLKKLTKKKPKVEPADFDELFARGLALSAQLESENNADPFKAKMVAEGITGKGEKQFTTFEKYSQEEGFRASQKEEGIGFAEKVTAYLDDQASTPQLNVDLDPGVPRERGRRRHRNSKQGIPGDAAKEKTEMKETAQKSRSQSDDKRKRSREYSKPEDIKLSPQIPTRDPFTGAELASNQSEDALFLAKVTEFVASNEVDTQYAQPVWPAIPRPEDKMPALKEPEPPSLQTLKRLSPLPGLAPPSPSKSMMSGLSPSSPVRLAPSPGKAFLDAVTGLDAFGPSIESDNPEQQADMDKLMSDTQKVADYINSNYSGVVVKPPTTIMTSPPREDEPGDKGLPQQLERDKLMANEEFYEKLRNGLKVITTPERLLNQAQEEQTSYQKYSHHLGRAEFGSLQRKKAGGASSRASATTSRDPSGDRVGSQPQRLALSRDTSGDKLNMGGGLSRDASNDKLNRGGLSGNTSGEKLNILGRRPVGRSESRMSEYSGGLPDLEVEGIPGDVENDREFDPVQSSVQRTQSLDYTLEGRQLVMETNKDVLVKREEVLKDLDIHKQQIKEAKAWIQNGLMTVVGVGVMAYLQTLEQMGGT